MTAIAIKLCAFFVYDDWMVKIKNFRIEDARKCAFSISVNFTRITVQPTNSNSSISRTFFPIVYPISDYSNSTALITQTLTIFFQLHVHILPWKLLGKDWHVIPFNIDYSITIRYLEFIPFVGMVTDENFRLFSSTRSNLIKKHLDHVWI